jgi:hypothetical protein
MNFEVWDQSCPDVSFEPAKVIFPAFEFYKKQAGAIAEYVQSIEVTDENIKDVKKELAQVRKVTDELSKRRIAIKREILTDFDVFEAEVKELSGIISSAEDELRGKVRELDEIERENKKAAVYELWYKRSSSYAAAGIPEAVLHFLKPQHLNKSTSMKAIEKEMVEWLEKSEAEINTLRKMGDEYYIEYLKNPDMTQAIQAVDERNTLKEMYLENEENETATATFIITGEKDITLTEMLLKSNNINFIRR